MNYTLHQLLIFTKVCEYQSITKASEALFLTQPAVSIQLKKLQGQFDIPLTEVIGRQLYITDFGNEINKLAIKILDTATEMEVITDQHKGILTGNIKIASASTGKYVIPYFLTEFMQIYPQVNISIDVTNKRIVLDHMQKNLIDFAMISVIPENMALECVPLINNEIFLVGSSHYPDLPERMTPKELKKHTLIFREEGSATKAQMQTFLNEKKINVSRSMQLTSNEAVKQAVRAGLGLSIMPLIGIQTEIKLKSLQIIPMNGLPIITQWNLTYSSGKKLSPACNALINYIEEHKERISEVHFS